MSNKKVIGRNSENKAIQNDIKALKSDWNEVGNDMRKVLCGEKRKIIGSNR